MIRAALALMLALALPARAEPLLVFAAASLKGPLDQVIAGFEAATGEAARASYAGSGALARQIDQGAPADVAILAGGYLADWLEQEGRVAPGGRVALLGNRLALIAHDAAAVAVEPALDLPALLGDGRLAMALVDAVPAGVYGAQALRALGLWADVADRVAQADNVRAALALVALGAAPLGLVYATDAQAEPRVCVLGVFPEESHDPIRYPALVIAGRDHPATARFMAWLTGPQARAVFDAAGFTDPSAP